jgi:hypothetical protein
VDFFPLKRIWEKHKESVVKFVMAIVVLTWIWNFAMFFLTGWASGYIFLNETAWKKIVILSPSALSGFDIYGRFALCIYFWAMCYGGLKI